MRSFGRVCVYCGSSLGRRPEYGQAAARLGRHLAEQGIGLVTGGGSIGMMGAIADAAIAAGGEVIGVIPDKLQDLELGHQGVELIVVGTMHERKHTMARLSDAFVAMPGGFGTLEEVFEATTWSQLNYHDKPVGLYNVDGYFDTLIRFLDRAVHEGFVRQVHRGLMCSASDPETLLSRMAAIDVPRLEEWLPNR